MIMGREKIDEQATLLSARLEEDADGELVEVVDVIIVAAVRYGVVDEGEAESQALFYRSSSALTHVQIGLLRHAQNAVYASVRTREGDDD